MSSPLLVNCIDEEMSFSSFTVKVLVSPAFTGVWKR